MEVEETARLAVESISVVGRQIRDSDGLVQSVLFFTAAGAIHSQKR
jgi:hypothetical protein